MRVFLLIVAVLVVGPILGIDAPATAESCTAYCWLYYPWSYCGSTSVSCTPPKTPMCLDGYCGYMDGRLNCMPGGSPYTLVCSQYPPPEGPVRIGLGAGSSTSPKAVAAHWMVLDQEMLGTPDALVATSSAEFASQALPGYNRKSDRAKGLSFYGRVYNKQQKIGIFTSFDTEPIFPGGPGHVLVSVQVDGYGLITASDLLWTDMADDKELLEQFVVDNAEFAIEVDDVQPFGALIFVTIGESGTESAAIYR